MAVTDVTLVATYSLVAIVGIELVRRIGLARRQGEAARLRFLVPQAVGLLLTSADVIAQRSGVFSGGVRAVTGVLFWVGLALIALGLLIQGAASRLRK